MAPKLARVRLDDVLKSLTKKEEGAAEMHLNSLSEKQQKSRMQCMTDFSKSNGDSEVEQSRGAKRRSYMLAFVAHQLRDPATRKALKIANEEFEEESNTKRVHRWSRETMELKLGKDKTASWIDSKLLHTERCPVTG